MFGLKLAAGVGPKAVLDALGHSLAIIEFDARGTILDANANFCAMMGYGLAEIKGRHHSMFVEPAEAQSPAYKEFWVKLGRGEFDAGEYRRRGVGGADVWIQASYNPVVSARGEVLKVVEVASVVTEEKRRTAEYEGKFNAVSLTQAIIEFTTEGEILTANQNFLDLTGYTLDEIKGRHHRIFVETAFANSADYRQFWDSLHRGEYVSAAFKRLGKGGREIWIRGSYNPIFDANGTIMKVVKFASDITNLVEVGAGLARFADNDLSERIEKAFTPAFDKLRVDYNQAQDRLHDTMAQIVGSVGVIQSGAQEILSASDDLSRRTEQQAASLEETAAALDQITATVRKSAEGAAHAREIVQAAKSDAERSGDVVRQAVQAMSSIERSAQQISQIIGVIDEIAFQTNLLALNAGVEAARAGDAGRGFAVVASEVRALAQRSAEAAKEIKGLISSSTSQVDDGVKLVAETGKSLERIMAQVSDINTVVSDIASGAKEQAVGLDEVNSAVNRMDKVTQQNAAMVEQSTAASHSLAHAAGQLSELTGKFNLRLPALPAVPTARPGHRPVPAKSRPATALKVTGHGGAAAKPDPEHLQDDWAEF